jgi:hypothetical protein
MAKKLTRQTKEHPKEPRCHVVCWEDKRKRDPFLVWDGSYRWFKSKNVVALEHHRTTKEINRIRTNVLALGQQCKDEG